MEPYVPPIHDYRFLLSNVLGFDAAMAEIGKSEIDVELAVSIPKETGRFCAERLPPINLRGDEEGSKLDAVMGRRFKSSQVGGCPSAGGVRLDFRHFKESKRVGE